MKKLQTLRCCLSKISKADQQDMDRLYTSAQTRKFLGGALSAQAAREKIDRLILDREEIFAVRLKENGAFLGLVYLNPYYDTPACELSYEFLPEFWGQGYACEVLSELLRYCGQERGEKELLAETQQKNTASRRLLEKLGFEQEKELTRFGERQMVYRIILK